MRFLGACLLLLATPAEACHKFSRWYYPYPQRCIITASVMPPIRSEEIQINPDSIFPPEAIIELNKQLRELHH